MLALDRPALSRPGGGFVVRVRPAVMCSTGPGPGKEPVAGDNDRGRGGEEDRAAFSSLLEDSAEDLYENAPCGYLSTLLDGQIAKINTTLLAWLGYTRAELVGRRRFSDLLTVGGRVYHETHFAPLLRMQGEVGGIALELKAADGTRLPVLVTSKVKTGADGEPLLIRTTVFDARDRRAYERELLRAREEADRERERVQRLATTLQRSLLPPILATVPGLEVAAHYHPASLDVVGGDFYDLFPISDQRWAFFIGDVCGKGAEAAAVTSLTRYTLRSATAYNPDPVAVLTNLNTVLMQEQSDLSPQFCTVTFGLLTPDQDSYTLTLGSGGHPPALLLRADGSSDYQPTPGGQAVGVLTDPRFATTTLRLRPGDTLLLYTDGLTEARTNTSPHRRYDEDALRTFATSTAPTTAPALITALIELLRGFGAGVEDDVALLAFSVPTSTPPRAPMQIKTP
jgi:phosphoserine phosphatase RsbU/P